MEKYKYLEHTSEAKFQAFGNSLEEAFTNAALAMMNIMTDTDKVKPIKKKKIRIESKNKESLLYDFLAELIYLVDAESIFISTFENMNIEGNVLTTEAFGDDCSNCPKGSDVKSPTYDEMIIQKDPYMVQVVVDV